MALWLAEVLAVLRETLTMFLSYFFMGQTTLNEYARPLGGKNSS